MGHKPLIAYSVPVLSKEPMPHLISTNILQSKFHYPYSTERKLKLKEVKVIKVVMLDLSNSKVNVLLHHNSELSWPKSQFTMVGITIILQWFTPNFSICLEK